MGFIKELHESKALRNQRGLNNLDAEAIAENIYMNILSLQAMRHDPNSMKLAQEYAKKTMMNSGFDNIRTTGTDLHNWISVMNQPERYADKIGPVGRASVPVHQLRRYLRDVASGKSNPNFDKQFLMSLERNLGIRNAQYSATRRLLSDWNRLYGSERKMSTTRLLQAIRAKSARSDLRSPYEKFMRQGGYEMKDAVNQEIVPKKGIAGKALAAAAIGVGSYMLGKKLSKAISGVNVKSKMKRYYK